MATVKKTIKKAQDGRKLLTPARTRQVADSLDNATKQINIGTVSALQKGDKETYEYGRKKADQNTANAKRYRALANKAEAKSKVAKPKAKDGKSMMKKGGKCKNGC